MNKGNCVVMRMMDSFALEIGKVSMFVKIYMGGDICDFCNNKLIWESMDQNASQVPIKDQDCVVCVVRIWFFGYGLTENVQRYTASSTTV